MRPSRLVRRLIFFGSLGSTAALALCAVETPSPTGEPDTFTADGAWCWFSDARAVYHEGRIFAGWITADGSVQIGARSAKGPRATTEIGTLAPQFERDDHDHPALLVLPDGRLAAFYSPHASGDMHFRTTLRPADISSWSTDRTLGFGETLHGPHGVTYANPFLLRDEGSALYLFWRGADFKPTFAVSHDSGTTWSTPRTLINERGRTVDNRPYVKYWSDRQARIDFVFTDGHPRNEPTNSVYFARYERGAFFRADGTRIGNLDALPLQPSQCDLVYDGRTAGRAWVWSVAEGRDGHPVIAYTRLPAEDDHRYHYARWDGHRWVDHEIVRGGRWFPRTPAGAVEREPHYSGGLALDPINPAIVYLSRPIGGVFEIEKWTTPDGGATWQHEAVTRDSPADNVRPFVVADFAPGRTSVMWMRNDGGYRHYTDYRTRLMLLEQ